MNLILLISHQYINYLYLIFHNKLFVYVEHNKYLIKYKKLTNILKNKSLIGLKIVNN